MSNTLTILFRREPDRDKECGSAPMEGYELLWPDGRPVAVGLDAFCKHGQRLLGLGKHLAGCQEKLIHLVCKPLSGMEARLLRIPGYRVRRFFVERTDRIGRIHFMDGTPTNTTFDMDQDEEAVLEWIGLTQIPDGERRWIDLAAVAIEHSSLLEVVENQPEADLALVSQGA